MKSHKSMRTWHFEKIKEMKMIRQGIDKLWISRIKKHKLWRYNSDYVFKFLWKEYPLERKFLDKVGYLVKIRTLSREYVGQLLRRMKK